MTFAVLGSIGAAIGSGLGAVSGGIAAGATALGASAGAASAIGTIGTGALVGSGLGAATSAAMGQDPGQGALFGAVGGGLTGGLGSLAGAGSGSAASGATSSIANAATPSVSSMFPAGAQGLGATVAEAGLGAAPTSSISSLFPAGAQTIGSIADSMSGILGAVPSGIMDMVGKPVLNLAVDQGLGGVETARISGANEQMGRDALAADTAERNKKRMEAKRLGESTQGFAGGGEIALEDGQFIFPADIVSALGNGSTDAGARFLDEFFMRGGDAGSGNT